MERDRFALIVSFDLAEEAGDAFRSLVKANAADSLRLEPGCLRFDVLTSEDGASPQVVLYEIYTDRAAFDRHLAMPHYLDFDQRTRAAVRNKAVRFFCLREAAC
jgi:quinol monooxygenase YgiN